MAETTCPRCGAPVRTARLAGAEHTVTLGAEFTETGAYRLDGCALGDDASPDVVHEVPEDERHAWTNLLAEHTCT